MERNMSEVGPDLYQNFTLQEEELKLLKDRTKVNKIGLAILLKFFQMESRFPQNLMDIPEATVEYIAQQIGVSTEFYSRYDLNSRNAIKHRKLIRQFTGFREGTNKDASRIQKWVFSHLDSFDYTLEQIFIMVKDRYKQLKIELTSSDRLERIASSVLSKCEEKLFQTIFKKMPKVSKAAIDSLLEGVPSLSFVEIKSDPGGIGLKSVFQEIQKLRKLRQIVLPCYIPPNLSEKYLKKIERRVSSESIYENKRHPDNIRYALILLYCYSRIREIIDSLVELLIGIIHKIGVKSERRVEKEIIDEVKEVRGKEGLLYRFADLSLNQPDGIIKEVLYPTISEQTMKDIIKEFKFTGNRYRSRIYNFMRASYNHHYRRMVPEILDNLEFRSNNEVYQPVIQALQVLRKYAHTKLRYYPKEEIVSIDGVIKKSLQELVIEKDPDGQERINCMNYEILVLETLREKLRCKEIWVVGANSYRNPDEDIPPDFNENRLTYYKSLNQPLGPESFTLRLELEMRKAMGELELSIPNNPYVRILKKQGGWISLSPLEPQKEPENLQQIKAEITRRWPMTSLLDILKEVDLRVEFSKEFTGTGSREAMSEENLQRRLILCLFGIATNTGLKRICAAIPGESYQDLLYVRRRYLHRDTLRKAIQKIVNDLFRIRNPGIWGEGTTTCASDSKKFGAWDQNLLTQWHIRYQGRGVMIYWHIEKHAACIYSQLKSCSSSEIAAMIRGVLRHCTNMNVERNYVDTHGQSEVGFAFCRLLNFQLMPRFKDIHRKKLYLPHQEDEGRYPNLEPILTRPIDWDLIRQQYDEMIKYTTALRLGTAEPEAILKRFTRENLQHPTYKALSELGRAERTLFLCRYLTHYKLRQEIQEGLNTVENWNSANSFIFYGKGGEMATNRLADQEISMLALHLLQISLVYVNTLMIQEVLSEKEWFDRLQTEDLRALTPLIYSHINPYGTFQLDMNERLPLYTP